MWRASLLVKPNWRKCFVLARPPGMGTSSVWLATGSPGNGWRCRGFGMCKLSPPDPLPYRSARARCCTRGQGFDSTGDGDTALHYYEQALPLRRAVGDRAGEAATLNNIGSVHSRRGDGDTAP